MQVCPKSQASTTVRSAAFSLLLKNIAAEHTVYGNSQCFRNRGKSQFVQWRMIERLLPDRKCIYLRDIGNQVPKIFLNSLGSLGYQP